MTFMRSAKLEGGSGFLVPIGYMGSMRAPQPTGYLVGVFNLSHYFFVNTPPRPPVVSLVAIIARYFFIHFAKHIR